MLERLEEIYNNVCFLAVRLPDGQAKTDQYINAHCLLRIANDILEENNLRSEMDERVRLFCELVDAKEANKN